MTIEKISGQQAITQYLVDPKNLTTPCYITSNKEVAQKRAAKGDYVVEIERADDRAHRNLELPIHLRVYGAPVADDEDEL